MNSSNMNNMHHDNETILPPLFRSMNLMPAAPAPLTLTTPSRETTLAKEQRPLTVVFPATVQSTTPTWAPMSSLRKLSYYHPLDPSHVTIERTALPDVMQGLAQAFQALSCQVTFATDTLVAVATTMQGVEFQVALWDNNNSTRNNHNNNTIICELQRMDGDSYIYHAQYAQPILKAVTTNDYTGLYNHPNSRNDCLGRTLDQVDKYTLPPCPISTTVTDEDIESALELATHMVLGSDRYDACILGLESLQCLTNPTSTGWYTATNVAQRLTMSYNAPLAQFLSTQLCHGTTPEMQYMALQIWVQMWQVLAASTMENVKMTVPDDKILAVLMQMVQHAADAPHHATLALQGLTALHPWMDPDNYDQENMHAVQSAAAIGQGRHAALAAASGQYLMAVHA